MDDPLPPPPSSSSSSTHNHHHHHHHDHHGPPPPPPPSNAASRTTSTTTTTTPPTAVRRQEKITWPTDEPPKTYGSFPPPLLLPTSTSSSTTNTYYPTSFHSPRTDRRLRWRALLVSLSAILGFACVLLVVILKVGGNGGRDGGGGAADEDYAYGDITHFRRHRHSTGAAHVPGKRGGGNLDENDAPFLLGAAAPDVSDSIPNPPTVPVAGPAQSYPSSAPSNPNIKIPVAMGCMEAMCETWMASLGKNHADSFNLSLLDCIQRTGMSGSQAQACFDAANLQGTSAERKGLYRCAVCKQCVPPKSEKQRAELCDSKAAAADSGTTSAALGGGPQQAGSPSSSSFSPSQYIPKGGFIPNRYRIDQGGGWFVRGPE